MAGKGSFVGSGAYLNVDMSDVNRTIEMLRSMMSRESFERLMYRTFNEVGRRSKTLISKPIPLDYEVNQKFVKQSIERYKLDLGGIGGAGVTCKIPLKGKKGIIGGTFALKSKSKKAKTIQAKIVKGQVTTLPAVMKNQGGNPPFIVRDAVKVQEKNGKKVKVKVKGKIKEGLVFTRRTKNRLPIVRVVGLGAPQMPLNRSSDEVADQILDYIEYRLDHNFYYMLEHGQL